MSIEYNQSLCDSGTLIAQFVAESEGQSGLSRSIMNTDEVHHGVYQREKQQETCKWVKLTKQLVLVVAFSMMR